MRIGAQKEQDTKRGEQEAHWQESLIKPAVPPRRRADVPTTLPEGKDPREWPDSVYSSQPFENEQQGEQTEASSAMPKNTSGADNIGANGTRMLGIEYEDILNAASLQNSCAYYARGQGRGEILEAVHGNVNCSYMRSKRTNIPPQHTL